MANDDTTATLRELLVWTRVGFYGSVKSMLSDVLNTDKKRLAYQLADGTKSADRIKSEASMGSDQLTDFFKQCISLGLMEMTGDGKRRRLFDLGNFGLMPEASVVKKNGVVN